MWGLCKGVDLGVDLISAVNENGKILLYALGGIAKAVA